MRGRLSAIDRLPKAADAVVAEARRAVSERRATQAEILRKLNADLAALGLPPVSRTGFNRWTNRVIGRAPSDVLAALPPKSAAALAELVAALREETP